MILNSTLLFAPSSSLSLSDKGRPSPKPRAESLDDEFSFLLLKNLTDSARFEIILLYVEEPIESMPLNINFNLG